MIRFHILHRSGWIGSSDHRPVHNRTEAVKPLLPGDIDVNKQTITINESAWDGAAMLMPMWVQQLMQNKQEKTADQELLRRECAPDAAPEADDNMMLLPMHITGR